MSDREPDNWSVLWLLVQRIRHHGLIPTLQDIYLANPETGRLLTLAITLSAAVVLLGMVIVAKMLLGLY